MNWFYHEQIKESVKKNNNKVMKSNYKKSCQKVKKNMYEKG